VELARLPRVDRLIAAPELARVRASLGGRAFTVLIREILAEYRREIRSGAPVPSWADILDCIDGRARRRLDYGLTHVVNATGVLLHTNLGRAPLSRASLERIANTAGGYTNLEFDIELGSRTRRGVHAERTLAELVGAEDALIVNNNAAGVLLALSCLAASRLFGTPRREVVVSRGELVEIGGGFRIPEVLARSGAQLVEVGTTNRTRVADYAAAIGERTACVLRVHPSNFKMTGFAERPSLESLAALAHEREVPLVKDLGGGLIVELSRDNMQASDLAAEPSVQACLRAGADLVCFSLDKLLGGPQGGMIVGGAKWVGELRADPLARALRVDKLTLAALEPTLEAYAHDRVDDIPLHAMLRAPLEQLTRRVQSWQRQLGDLSTLTSLEMSEAAIGGGTLAEAPLSSVALAVRCDSPDQVARALRCRKPAIIGRICDDVLLLDARTVLPDEDAALVVALREVLAAMLGRSTR